MPDSELRIVTRDSAVELPFEPGAVLIDKPKGPTSFGVIKKVRWALNEKKVGHAGTLDPMATGLLIVLVGREATPQQDRFMGLPKVYSGTIRLGQTTASFDAETPIEEERDASSVTDEMIEAARVTFEGEIQQVPPIYSAIKVGGERLYKKARRGEEIEIEPRTVSIYSLELANRRGDDIDFRMKCSKGTYVRSLARDLGEALGVGAHLTALRRDAIGPFRVDEALTPDELALAAGPTQDSGRR